MSKEHDAPALARREPTISDADREAIGKAARAGLRDRFAEKAMEKMIDAAGRGAAAYHDKSNRDALAKLSWGIADSMMEARGHE